MSSRVGVAKEIASLITGILLLYASCGNYMKMLAHQTLQREADLSKDKNKAQEEEER